MNSRQILTASVALALGHAAWADDVPAQAQPITLSTTAGLDQSDFHMTTVKLNSYLFFSAITKEIPAGKKTPASEVHSYFSQKILKNITETFFEVNKFAPLVKKSSVTLPVGTELGDFRRQVYVSASGDNRAIFFHVPTKGLYHTNGAAAPGLVRAETAANPISGYALSNYDEEATNTDHSLQFRLVLGSYVPQTKKLTYTPGDEPTISKGTSSGNAVLKTPAGGVVTQTSSYTSYVDPTGATGNRVAFFVGKDTTGVVGIYKTTESNANPRVPKYGATLVSNFELITPNQLTGCNVGLVFADDDGTGTRRLYVFNDDQSAYNEADGAGTDPQDITPKVIEGVFDDTDEGLGYTSVDAQGKRRFSAAFSGSGTPFSKFTDPTASYVDPVHITAGGGSADYYFYGATFGNYQYALKDFYSSSANGQVPLIHGANFLVNPTEFCEADGDMYLVADEVTATGTPVSQARLYKNSEDDTAGVCTLVPASGATFVVGAHNLRAVVDHSQIFRLYFSAPINSQQNAEQIPAGSKVTDFANKPWVVYCGP